jgi:2',3'-cyclic-nucleotide 2'-phosphodiesterase (5'-nucleotidase family)
LLLDSGESLFRGGYSIESENPKQGALFVAAMNAMGYDAMALGGRDLEAPQSTLQARFDQAQFPILSANVAAKDTLPNFQPYLLREVGGHVVAIVGATSGAAAGRLETIGLDPPQDVFETVAQAVRKAKRRADVILVLSNLERSESEVLAQTVPGIDAIIGVYGGAQRTPVALPGAEGQVVLHASGSRGEHLGVLTLHLDARGQVTDFEGRPLALTPGYADAPEIIELTREYAAQQ